MEETSALFVLWLGDDNKTTVTVRVNIYAVDFKGQSLVHVPLAFFTPLGRKHELQMWESHSCEVRLEKWKPEAAWNKHLRTLQGRKTNTSIYVSLIQKRNSTRTVFLFYLRRTDDSTEHMAQLDCFAQKGWTILSAYPKMCESNFLAEV